MTIEIFVLAGGVILGAAMVWFLLKKQSGPAQPSIDANFLEFSKHMSERLDRVMAQVDARLRENTRAVNESKSFLTERVSSTERAVREVSAGLGKLGQATDALRRSADEITNFQQLLKNPKVRGGFGEILLTNLLSQVLPTDYYQLQYQIKSTGEIADAIISFQDGNIVAIDAKFPLANYEIYAQEQDEALKRQAKTLLARDIKKHVQDISRKYISPADRTFDFAFMYIPMEGIYYETMVKDLSGENLGDFCLRHHVVPVSPNSFMAYLHTVLIGLRGLKIQQQAKEILQNLSQVRHDFGRFGEEFMKVGSHLTHAKNKFEESSRHLDKFTNRLDQIENLAAPQLADQTEERVGQRP